MKLRSMTLENILKLINFADIFYHPRETKKSKVGINICFQLISVLTVFCPEAHGSTNRLHSWGDNLVENRFTFQAHYLWRLFPHYLIHLNKYRHKYLCP